jgi:hypothetical protein
MIIYKITNLLNNKIYVGKSELNNPNYYGSGTYITRAIKKYGKENFKKEILFESEEYNLVLLNEKEIYWIEFLDSMNPDFGYNLHKGGTGLDREDAIKMWKDPEGRKRRVKSISKNSLETWKDPEIRGRRIESFKKNWQDPEFRIKKIESTKKAMNKPETRSKLSNTGKNLWKDPEYREKMMKALNTPEAKKNRIDSHRHQMKINKEPKI